MPCAAEAEACNKKLANEKLVRVSAELLTQITPLLGTGEPRASKMCTRLWGGGALHSLSLQQARPGVQAGAKPGH